MTAFDSTDLPAISRPAALPWAAFLGISWTWCIGMFLPVLLVRDAGAWSWLVFAIPNVVGAAAMGWVLTSSQQSRRMVQEHAVACRMFSIVTIAFHVFFVLWLVPRLVGLPAAAVVFPLTAIYLLFTISQRRFDLPVAVAVWLLSFGLFLTFLRNGPARLPDFAAAPSAGAIYLLPVCFFGFAFCPYLDLTFHRARQALEAPAASRTGFGVGFGFFFFSMIVFSLLYSRALAPLVGENWRDQLRPAWGWMIATHMIVQAAYTLSAHARSYLETRPKPASVLTLLIVCQTALLFAFVSPGLPRWVNLDFGEICYRFFMAFYGLLFPAYVWFFMMPGRSVTATGVRGFTLSVLIALPMYFAGFMLNRMVWLVPGVLCAFVGRVLVRIEAPTEGLGSVTGSLPEA